MMLRALLKITLSELLIGAGWANNAAAETVMETISLNPNLTTVNKLIQDASLADSLGGVGPVTVFAPSNSAFSAIPAGKLAELTGNKELLKSVLSYHVIAASLVSESIKNGPQKTATGDSISVYKAGTVLTVENAVVTQADLKASNGVVQIIDTVLMPPSK